MQGGRVDGPTVMVDGHAKFHPVEQLEEVPLYFSEEKQMVDSILDQVTGVLKVWHRGYCTALQHYNVLYCTLCNLYNHLESKGIWLHKFTQGALNCTQSCGSSLSIKNQFVQSSLVKRHLVVQICTGGTKQVVLYSIYYTVVY